MSISVVGETLFGSSVSTRQSLRFGSGLSGSQHIRFGSHLMFLGFAQLGSSLSMNAFIFQNQLGRLRFGTGKDRGHEFFVGFHGPWELSLY